MLELRKIFCKTLDELPSLDIINAELVKHDRIRIDFDINSKFKSSVILKKYIQNIEHELNVEIHKGKFQELAFYNIYSLFSDKEKKHLSTQLELAVKEYRLISEKLINEFENKYNHSFTDPGKSIYSIREQLDLDQHKLSKHWGYRFHGGDVCFSNSNTGQIVDINLGFVGYYGVLDLWFFQYFMRTTKEFKLISDHLEDNTPKLNQLLNYLKENGIVKVVVSELFDSEKLIWNK